MSEILGVRVAGLPVPQGSKKLVRTKRKDGTYTEPRMIDDNSHKLKHWRGEVAKLSRAALPVTYVPTTGPVRVVLLFALPRPASAPKRRRVWPSGRVGDIDKLARAVLDALTGPVFRDDAQVVQLTAVKDYPGPAIEQLTPGVLISVHRVEDHLPPRPESTHQEGLPIP